MNLIDNEYKRIDKYNKRAERQISNKLKGFYTELYKDIQSEILNLSFKYGNGKEITISDINKFNRLDMLRNELSYKINKKYQGITNEIITSLIEQFKSNYYSTMYISELGANYNIGSIFLNDNIITNAINHKIKRLTLSDRLERNRKIIIKETITTISKGLALGNSTFKIAQNIKGLYENDMTKAVRISRTESNRILNTAKYKAYQEAKNKGIKFNETWLSTPGNRTRDLHKDLNGQIKEGAYFKIGKYKAKHPGGFGSPEMDINCRCTTRVIFEELDKNLPKRQESNGITYIEYKDFDSWATGKNAM
jgi:SPP1 gp7 family putative phage head morphogenesis protein